MNPQTLKLIVTAFSMKKEIKLFFFTILILCLLPVFAVIILTQAGFNLVSETLATINPTTSLLEIHDPADGSIIETLTEPRIWPVSGPVSLEFGSLEDPYQPFHTGIDIATTNHQVGDPVGAFMKGTVIYAGETSTGFGKHVEIDHGSHIVSIYGHLDSIAVTVGQEVDMGTVIGTRGNTGWSTGPHLHFQINVFGIPVNPRVFLSGNP
jgi:murein DD-endopeptidase MepM/ murein hydrolase activator NlpD